MIIKILKQETMKQFNIEKDAIKNYGYSFTDEGASLRIDYFEEDDSVRSVSQFFSAEYLSELVKQLTGEKDVTPFELLFG